jgi:hypothetical protein
MCRRRCGSRTTDLWGCFPQSRCCLCKRSLSESSREEKSWIHGVKAPHNGQSINGAEGECRLATWYRNRVSEPKENHRGSVCVNVIRVNVLLKRNPVCTESELCTMNPPTTGAEGGCGLATGYRNRRNTEAVECCLCKRILSESSLKEKLVCTESELRTMAIH